MTPGETRKRFLENGSPPGQAASLYVHVPFCRTRCRYCDFCSSPYEPDRARRVMIALLRELDRRRVELEVPLLTAFLGGGTPTVLPEEPLRRLCRAIAELGDDRTEFTVEANPNSLTESVVEVLAESGVNRLSIGVQSFLPQELALLGRLHGPDEAMEAIHLATAGGFDNLSLDLIYGVPDQTPATFRRSLDLTVQTGVAHVSCYALSIEPGTDLADELAAGRIQPMDEAMQRECYDLAVERLDQAGLRQYEISNFARPGRACRHNLTYWHNRSYAGIGPSAVSYVGGRRSRNTPDLDAYADRVAAGQDPTEFAERITGRMLLAETLMLTLRLRDGVDRAAFAARFGADPAEEFSATVRRHCELGSLELTPTHLRLARQALFVADTVLADIIAEAQH